MAQSTGDMLSADINGNSLDISDIRIDKSLPPAERVRSFLKDGYDPYRLTVGSTDVRIRFREERSLTSCLARAFSSSIDQR